MPTELVLPVSISCLCLNKPTRARPRPSSKAPRVSTPSVVDFPESTFPTTAHLTSGVDSTVGGGILIRQVARVGCSNSRVTLAPRLSIRLAKSEMAVFSCSSVRRSPVHPVESSEGSASKPEDWNRSSCGGLSPRCTRHSPRLRVTIEATKSVTFR
jgi:hypothetical protein